MPVNQLDVIKMDFDTSRKMYFSDPLPETRFNFKDLYGTTLYYEDLHEAAAFFEKVIGPPACIEDRGTRGWQAGKGWLTLLHGKRGNPTNVEVTFELETVEESEKLHRAFIQAGAKGETPSDQLMYRLVRYCPVTDPFGVDILVISAQHSE